MINSRKFALLAATAFAAAMMAMNSLAQNAGISPSTYSELRPPVETGTDTLHSRLSTGTVGLRPQGGNVNQGIALPFGMNYSRDTKSLMMPLDQKSEWGVGLNLNMNSAPALEQSPSSGLGLQPKRTPGIMLQRKF